MRHIDHELVAKTFAELGDKRATAQRLGIHENSVYQILRGLAEKCTRCGGPRKTGETYCATCRDWSASRMRDRRAERNRLGLCHECDEPRSPLSRQYCDTHRKAAIDRRAAHDARKRARFGPRDGAQIASRRETAIVRTYGADALAAWREAGAACEVCGTPHGQASVQIHHIDENRKNGARSNLAVLCFDCHLATHRLLAVRDRPAFLAWFAQHYAP